MHAESLPRRWYVGIRFILLSLAALSLLAGVSVASAALSAWWRDGGWLEPTNLWVGLVCGLVASLFVAVFHLRKESSTLAVGSHEQFLGDAQRLLREMGYEVTSRRADFLDTRPGFHAILFGPGVQVALEAGHARITGPKYSVERLRMNLRMRQQLSRVQHALVKNQANEPKLKRVELKMRVTPEQLAQVQTHVLASLAKEADVVCEVSVLAQSDEGIRQSTVEVQVRDWLDRQGIPCELHKDFIKIVELARE
jgi:hypothetical protein